MQTPGSQNTYLPKGYKALEQGESCMIGKDSVCNIMQVIYCLDFEQFCKEGTAMLRDEKANHKLCLPWVILGI